MSRTKKDRPYHIILRDRSAYPTTARYEHHDHARLGQPHYYVPRTYNRETEQWVAGEPVLQGHFSSECTVHLEARDLPPGILQPCWQYAWLSRGRPDRWERANNKARQRALRSRSRVELHSAAKLADSGEDVGDEMLGLPRRELYSWG